MTLKNLEKLPLNLNQIDIALSRRKLINYCKLINPQFETPNHIKLIAETLEKVESGEIDRLIISMPPRHGKSMTVSDYFSSWFIGKNPEKYVIQTSYGDELAIDFGRKIKNRIESDEKFREIFPDCVIAHDSRASGKFSTTKDGTYFAVGRGGALTGRGGDLIIIDDLIKNSAEAGSDTIIRSIQDWYSTTLYTRLMPKGAIVIVATRWTDKDLTSYVKNLEATDPYGKKWTELCLPAINEQGESLWPERFPIETLLATKHQIGSYHFNALYQQNPTAREGTLFKRSWFKFYKERPTRMSQQVQAWDFAVKGNIDSDFTAGIVGGKVLADIYILDLIKEKLEFPQACRALINLSLKWPQAYKKVIEGKANGPAVIQTLSKQVSGLVEIQPGADKIARASSVTAVCESGNVYLPSPEIAPWVNDFIESLCSFPYGAHDDDVDAFVYLLTELTKSGTVMAPMSGHGTGTIY